MTTNPVATFAPQTRLFSKAVKLYPDRISYGAETYPLTGVTAEVTASGGRLSGHRGLLIEGPSFAWTLRITNSYESKARKFAAAVRLAARQYTP
jgi:hypothetical protein